MAGDWLKVEKDTPEKPEVLVLATLLGVSVAEAFGRCFLVWRWADSQTTDGRARGVTTALLDGVAGLRGFARALARVGWLQVHSGALTFPNFDRHMGASAKRRALDAVRKQCRRGGAGPAESVRKMSAKCPLRKRTKCGPEKRREEKSIREDPPNPPAGGAACDSFDRFWQQYPRKTHKVAAREAWQRLAPDDALFSLVLAALERQRQSDQWRRGVIPNACNWLRDQGWEDDLGPAPAPGRSHDDVCRKAAELRERARQDRARAAPPSEVRAFARRNGHA